MRTRDDIEAYLARSRHPNREVADQLWVVEDPSGGGATVAVRLEDGLCLFRMKVLDLGTIEPAQIGAFLRALLEFNATEMVHGAYGIADEMVVVTASLLLENLDYNEFVGVLEEMVVTTVKHRATIATFRREGR